jgi:hypothetical protein
MELAVLGLLFVSSMAVCHYNHAGFEGGARRLGGQAPMDAGRHSTHPQGGRALQLGLWQPAEPTRPDRAPLCRNRHRRGLCASRLCPNRQASNELCNRAHFYNDINCICRLRRIHGDSQAARTGQESAQDFGRRPSSRAPCPCIVNRPAAEACCAGHPCPGDAGANQAEAQAGVLSNEA